MNSKGDSQRRERRTTSNLGHGGISLVIKDKVAKDPAWKNFARNGAWVCPFCLAAVKSHDETQVALLRAIEGHIVRRCPMYKNGQGVAHPPEMIQAKLQTEDIAHFAVTDPAWRVFDAAGFWYSPASLQRVPSVRILNSRFDNFTIQSMINHLMSCPHFKKGALHPADAVQRARDRDMRASTLVGTIRQLIQFPLWRCLNRAGNWVCPFCLGHVPNIVMRGDADWQRAPDLISQHLAYVCTAYVAEKPEAKPEAAVQQSAAANVSPIKVEPYNAPIMSTPSGAQPRIAATPTPMSQTALRTPTGWTPITGRPLAPGQKDPTRGNAIPPVAKPYTGPLPGRAGQQQPAAPPPAALSLNPLPPPPGSPSPRPPPKEEKHPTTRWTARSLPPPPGTPPASAPASPLPPDDALTPIKPPPAALSPIPPAIPTPAAALDWMDDVEKVPAPVDDQAAKHHDSERLRAVAVQAGFLQIAPQVPGFRFATRFEACADVTGDFYEFIRLPDGRIGFAQGDVSGHGMQAALVMSMAKKTVAIYASAGDGPRETLTKVNDNLVDDLGGKLFISMIYGILDPSKHTITWARAGHNPVIRFNTRTGVLTEIKPKGMVVGMKAGATFSSSLEEQAIAVESGDLLLIYTDGITETMNRQQVEYGVELLKEVVRKHAKNGPDALVNVIMDSVRQFRGGGSSTDDSTLLALAVD